MEHKLYKELSDGIYLLQADGSKVLFTGKNSNEECKGCKYIGLKMGSKSICIALKDVSDDRTPLTVVDLSEGNRHLIDNYIDITSDWSGKENTSRLKQIGLSKNIRLENDEYIPAVGELKFIQLFWGRIQKALDYVGGKPLHDEWYWTSTERSRSDAWGMTCFNGYLGWGQKAVYCGRVRAVKEF